MFIHCKHCGSLVATDPATGLPPERCPRCRDALRSMTPSAPQVSVATLLKTPAPVAVDAPSTSTTAPEAVATPAPPGVPASTSTTTVKPPAPAATAARADAEPEPATAVRTGDAVPPGHAPATRPSPSFVRRRAAGQRDARAVRQQRLLSAAVVALTALLGLQILLADRARLAGDAGWRPMLARICGVLHCTLPPWREPAALTVLARDVRPDASQAGRLIATATFRNDARWAQAWPRLRLTLSDIDGHNIGSRVFTVDEYLGAAPETPTIAAGHSVDVRLQLVEADARAVSFAFDFL